LYVKIVDHELSQYQLIKHIEKRKRLRLHACLHFAKLIYCSMTVCTMLYAAHHTGTFGEITPPRCAAVGAGDTCHGSR